MVRNVGEATQSRKSWRDVLKIHPAAEFPPMSREELVELGQDILKNGLMSRIALTRVPGGTDDCVLDGVSRLDALEANGVPLVDDGELVEVITLPEDGRKVPIFNRVSCDDPYEYVRSINILRRHLTPEQKRDAIDKLILANPEKSDRQLAKMAKSDHKVVGRRRAKLESTGATPQLEKTVGADGRSRTAKPKKKSEAPKSTEPATVAVSSAPVPSSAVFVVHDDPADAGEADPPARATTLDKQVLANDLMRTLRAVLALGTAREIWAAIETAPNRGEIKLVLDRVHQLIVDLHSRYSGAVP